MLGLVFYSLVWHTFFTQALQIITDMHKTILISIFLGLSIQAQCQDSLKSIRTWISVGTNVPLGVEFNEVHGLGLNSNIFLGFVLFKNFNLGPSFNFNYHVKYLNESTKDQLTNTGIGLNANYSFHLNKTTLYFGIMSYYENLNDKIAPRKDYGGEDLKILYGSGISFGPKLSLNYEKFIFQLGYLIRNFEIKFDQNVTSPFTSYNQLYEIFSVEENANMNFSSLTISMGYEL
jgi:hypothetical protein